MKNEIQTAGGCISRAILAVIACLWLAGAARAAQPENFFANPGFEFGRDGWQVDKAGKTEFQFTVDDQDAAVGHYSALLTVGSVDDWGAQFGQSFSAGDKGKTYTFAVLVKSVQGPVEMGLNIERSGEPYDRAGSETFTATNQWQELHVTFKVEKDFRQGWFAYVSCEQPKARLRVDNFRLYEGSYIPYKEVAQQEMAVVGVRVFDAGKPAAAPLSSEALSKREGWTELPEDDVSHHFKGAAVFMNDRVAFVLRPGARGAEVYSLGPEAPVLRACLTPLAGTNSAALSSFTILENSPAAGAVEAVFATAGGQKSTVRYELEVGQPFVQTEARAGATSLRVEAPCRFAVMPDFFADDLVLDAAELPVTEADVPSDNLLLHLLPDEQAIVMTVAKNSEEDAHINLSGEGDKRMIVSSDLRYGKDAKIWVAILAAPGIWHAQPVAMEQAGQVIAMDWKTPFPAQWRTDWRRDTDLTDSWEMLAQRSDGQFIKFGLFGEPDTIPASRKRWNTVLGDFKYPCWIDKNSQGYLQPFKDSVLQFQGPAVMYPINRAPATALDAFTVADVMRNTLGLGPCEYILDIEGQQSQYKGRATCSVRDTLNPIYSKGQQIQRHAEIEKVLEDLMIFIRHIRGRIESYVAFGHETQAYLAAQLQAHPELAAPVAELQKLTAVIDANFAARKEAIKTPDAAAKMVEEFRQTVLDYEGGDALARCKRFTEGWVDIGGNQDELAGECRYAAKALRQKASLLAAIDPRMAGIAKEIRRRTQAVLRNPANHESATH